jgi:hypothetical protein
MEFDLNMVGEFSILVRIPSALPPIQIRRLYAPAKAVPDTQLASRNADFRLKAKVQSVG